MTSAQETWAGPFFATTNTVCISAEIFDSEEQKLAGWHIDAHVTKTETKTEFLVSLLKWWWRWCWEIDFLAVVAVMENNNNHLRFADLGTSLVVRHPALSAEGCHPS